MQSTRSAILGLAVVVAAGAAVAPAAQNTKAEAEARATTASTAPAKQQPARIVASVDVTNNLRWRRLRRTPRWSFRGLRDKPWGGSVKKHARAMAQKRRAAR